MNKTTKLSLLFQRLVQLYPFKRGLNKLKFIFVPFFRSKKLIGRTFQNNLMRLRVNSLLEWEILSSGYWEKTESELILNSLNKKDIFYDIGANIGYFS